MTVSERRGWLLKGSDVVNGVTCRRYGKLGGDYFETYRGERDEKPSSVWPLHPQCEVTPLEEKELTVRAKGKSTLVALVAWKYEKLNGFCFTVSWPPGLSTKTSKVVLGFETETLAAQWQTSFLEAIQNLGMVPNMVSSQSISHSKSSCLEVEELDSEGVDGMSQMIESPCPTVERTCVENSDVELSGKADQMQEAVKTPNSRTMRVASSSTATTSASDLHDNLSNRTYASECYWCPWQHINGVAVYREDVGKSTDCAYMVSTIIRAPPSMCFQALMGQTSSSVQSSTGFLDMEVMEELSNDMQIVHTKVEAMGWVGQLYAPREIVAERSWRLEEEEGTYVILLQSTDNYVAENEADKPWGPVGFMRKPVRAQVKAAGFTIAPLQEKYCPDPLKSPESLVTMVLKVDLGGSCGSDSWLNSISHMLGAQQAWIECMLMTVVCLRDRVEQSRFVTLPFCVASSSSSFQQRKQNSTVGLSQAQESKTENDVEFHTASSADITKEILKSAVEIPVGSLNASLAPKRWHSGTLNPKFWSCPGAAEFRVRGKNYLTDRKKIEAGIPEFELRSVDLVRVDKPTPHIARYLKSIRCSTAGFTFVVQIMVPGPPNLGLVIAWGSKDSSTNIVETTSNTSQKDIDLDSEPSPFDIALMRFVDGDDNKRNDMFKLIPHIVKGSWIIRQSVGSTPVLLGHKLQQYYHRCDRYVEVDINVGSSYTAASVVGLVSGATKSLCVDLAIVMEGRSMEELPEALLGTVRFDRLDLGEALYLDTSREIPLSECSSPSGNDDKQALPSQ